MQLSNRLLPRDKKVSFKEFFFNLGLKLFKWFIDSSLFCINHTEYSIEFDETAVELCFFFSNTGKVSVWNYNLQISM